MRKLARRAFTAIELMVVAVIVVIVAAMVLPAYVKATERAKAKEAKSILKMIASGEQMYMVEFGSYYPSIPGTQSDYNVINDALRTDIQTEGIWDYSITSAASSGTTDSFVALASRVSGPYRLCQYRFIGNVSSWLQTEPAPAVDANCP